MSHGLQNAHFVAVACFQRARGPKKLAFDQSANTQVSVV